MPGDLPIEPTGRYSVFHLPRYWYSVALSKELKHKPVARQVYGIPFAIFRDTAGKPTAVLDRCPHRNAPLSIGNVRNGELECRYHGWRFDSTGACRAVPGYDGEPNKAARRVDTFPCVERNGIVWVVPSFDPPVIDAPLDFPHIDDPAFTTAMRSMKVPGQLFATIENALDVPHTSFLHKGFHRSGEDRTAVQVTIRHGDGTVEAEFEGEPKAPFGPAGRYLAPKGSTVEHIDRFIMPSVAQVEYHVGDSHLYLTSAYTPISDTECIMHAAATFKTPIPGGLIKALVQPFGLKILQQDNWILEKQRDVVRRFGGERFANTPIDVLGPHIAKMMRRAERNEAPEIPTEHEQVTLYT